MPSLVLLIEQVSPMQMESAMNAVCEVCHPRGVKAWTYNQSSLPSSIAEACQKAFIADQETGA